MLRAACLLVMLWAAGALAQPRIVVINPDGTSHDLGEVPGEDSSSAASSALIPVPRHLEEGTQARLQGLNKITARTSGLEAKIGETITFDTLEITVHRCAFAPPEESPESTALLEIKDTHGGGAEESIFLGWMFASTPGLSALEHPVYDVSVLGCTTESP